jgi:hypothetical protein
MSRGRSDGSNLRKSSELAAREADAFFSSLGSCGAKFVVEAFLSTSVPELIGKDFKRAFKV